MRLSTLAGPPLALVLCLFGVTGCSTQITRSEADELFLATFPQASEVQAGCVVDKLISLDGIEGLERELEAEEPTAAFKQEQFRAMFGCGMTSELDEEMGRQVLLVEDGRLSAATSSCVGTALVANIDEDGLEVLLSGEITDEFSETYYLALQACDALP